jgi:phosphoribosyl 1,2-cyclic phosphodiesterase
MHVQVASLNSGSNGNCYYIGNDEDAVLVDMGISWRESENRMRQLGVDPQKLRAVFISHEHTDHISGLPGFCKKNKLPVYITTKTLGATGFAIGQELLKEFSAYETLRAGSLTITAFPKQHDAIDPHSFVISSGGIHVGVFTDIGAPCKKVIHYFRQCHAVFLETNYDEAMLAQSRYPPVLQRRIRGSHGHLSNEQALQLFTQHRSRHLTHVFLSHLSRENNDPDLVLRTFAPLAGGVQVVHAPRDRATALYKISSQDSLRTALRPMAATSASQQLNLFST